MITGKTLGDKAKTVIEHILKLQSYIQKMQSLQVDNQEYAYLKALLLFSPGKNCGFIGTLSMSGL